MISEETAVFPGDTPFSRDILMSQASGDNLDLSTIKTTVHIGAHTDAPNHYDPKGKGIEGRELTYYLGKAQVITVSIQGRIQPEDIKVDIQAPRLLFKTNSFPDPNHWNNDFTALSESLVNFLNEQGVITVGIDTPSVDPATDKILESHRAIASHDMAILEGIVLNDVEDGLYDLIALPLKIKDADASPVRAILLEDRSL